jgi:uncharacterized protein (DUF433 family)
MLSRGLYWDIGQVQTFEDVTMQTQWNYLAPNPKSAYKQLFVRGTRIRAEVLYGMLVDGNPPDRVTEQDIAADMNVPVEAVREAIAYCKTDPPEIREDHAREEARLKRAGLMDAEGNYLRPPGLGSLPAASQSTKS